MSTFLETQNQSGSKTSVTHRAWGSRGELRKLLSNTSKLLYIFNLNCQYKLWKYISAQTKLFNKTLFSEGLSLIICDGHSLRHTCHSLISIITPVIQSYRIHFLRANPRLHMENVMFMSPRAGLLT